MQDDGALEAGERGERVLVGRARVDDRRAGRAPTRARAARRRCAAGRRVVRGRGSSRGPSPRRRRPSDARARRGARRRRRRPPRADGCRAPRTTPSWRSAMASVSRQDGSWVPTLTMRVTPASRARSTTTSGESSSASRCACVSITLAGPVTQARRRGARRAGTAARPARSLRRRPLSSDESARAPDRRVAARARRGSRPRSPGCTERARSSRP